MEKSDLSWINICKVKIILCIYFKKDNLSRNCGVLPGQRTSNVGQADKNRSHW